MKLAIATAIAALTLASSAFADTRLTATLDTPTSAKLIAAHAVWNCAGTTCVASTAPDESAGVSGCQELARKIGHVSAYAGEAKALDASGLDKCNKAAHSPVPIGTASR